MLPASIWRVGLEDVADSESRQWLRPDQLIPRALGGAARKADRSWGTEIKDAIRRPQLTGTRNFDWDENGRGLNVNSGSSSIIGLTPWGYRKFVHDPSQCQFLLTFHAANLR